MEGESKMIIKVKLEGELLECLKKDAESNLRTHPAQIIYYLRQIYEEQLRVSTRARQAPSITPVVSIKSPEDSILVKEVPKSSILDIEEPDIGPLVSSPEPQEGTTSSGICKDDTIYIPDDILNF